MQCHRRKKKEEEEEEEDEEGDHHVFQYTPTIAMEKISQQSEAFL
jgi:hypothetical protein